MTIIIKDADFIPPEHQSFTCDEVLWTENQPALTTATMQGVNGTKDRVILCFLRRGDCPKSIDGDRIVFYMDGLKLFHKSHYKVCDNNVWEYLVNEKPWGKNRYCRSLK